MKCFSPPIKALQKGVEIVGTGNLDYRIGTSGTDEIAQLAGSFDAMVDSLKNLTVSRDRLNQELAERKLAVEELRRSESQFKAIYESSSDAMVLMTDDGFIECNRRAVEMFGAASKAEFLKLKPEDISPLRQPDGENSVFAGRSHAQWAFQNGSDHFKADSCSVWISPQPLCSASNDPLQSKLASFNLFLILLAATSIREGDHGGKCAKHTVMIIQGSFCAP